MQKNQFQLQNKKQIDVYLYKGNQFRHILKIGKLLFPIPRDNQR